MRKRLFASVVGVGVLGMCVAAASALSTGVLAAEAQAMSIEGVWVVRVTTRDCATGNPLGLPFNSLLTFGKDGSLIESTGALAFAPGQRTNAHGAWRRLGAQTYAQSVMAIIRFTTDPVPPFNPGFLAGAQTIDQTIEQSAPDAFTSSGTTTFYDENGDPYRNGCATAIGRRYQ